MNIFLTILLALPAVFAAPRSQGWKTGQGLRLRQRRCNVNVDGQDYCFPAATWSEYMDTRFTAEFCPGYFPGYPNPVCKTVTVCPLIGDYQQIC
ncbi:hypothetical protein RAB80_009189 [Fusarium oxysporum f. sp. vasinfectum]|nr:hypothetical protein RAB80_009189 [Fusarium oxysporum f. sp. vasinfectum]